MSDNKFECDYCGRILTKDQLKIEEKFSESNEPCWCKEMIFIDKKNKKIKKLKTEIAMLEELLSMAQPESWDLDSIYEDAIDGRDMYTGEIGEPNEQFAKWLKKRWNLDANHDLNETGSKK